MVGHRPLEAGIGVRVPDRQQTTKVVPKAEEAINYQIPTFKLNGNLAHKK